jgi:hypothetical protein
MISKGYSLSPNGKLDIMAVSLRHSVSCFAAENAPQVVRRRAESIAPGAELDSLQYPPHHRSDALARSPKSTSRTCKRPAQTLLLLDPLVRLHAIDEQGRAAAGLSAQLAASPPHGPCVRPPRPQGCCPRARRSSAAWLFRTLGLGRLQSFVARARIAAQIAHSLIGLKIVN